MKKLINIIIVTMLLLLSKGITAQILSHTDTLPSSDTSKLNERKISQLKDYLEFKGGKVMLMQNNKLIPMETDMTMKNGSVVMTNGMVKTEDGKLVQLTEGDRVYMNGLISRNKQL